MRFDRLILAPVIIILVSVLLVSCIQKELSDEELDAELDKLSAQELQDLADEDLGSSALAGQAGRSNAESSLNRFINKIPSSLSSRARTTPVKKIQERVKIKLSERLRLSPNVCGDSKCDPVETDVDCPQDCKISLPESKCFDSDGGVNPGKQGAIKIEGINTPQEKCVSAAILEEKYCKDDKYKSTSIDCQDTGKVCNNGECVLPSLAFTCGNGICENNREIESGCSYDCGWGACKGGKDQCNEKVDAYCACQEDEFIITPLYKNGNSCNSCGKQETLFDDFTSMQTQVYDCLANYFQFSPPRVPNMVIYDSSEEICNNKYGCYGYEGGWSSLLGVVWNPLQGSRNYGENQPTEQQQLTADKHETAHYFLNQMIHGPPGWFTEAIAIQTNERLVCHPQENPKGDSYLKERENDFGGIIMSDNTVLNENYYIRLKNGETSLSDPEKKYAHIIGTLWVMGLKLDYGCTENCVRDIVLHLKDHIDKQCQLSQDACRLERWIILDNSKKTSLYIWVGNNIKNSIVKQKTDLVVGQDTSPLFDLLEIK